MAPGPRLPEVAGGGSTSDDRDAPAGFLTPRGPSLYQSFPMERPTLRQLEYFVAVAERLSFRKAAESCFVSQPSLSSMVVDKGAMLNQT